MIPGAAPAEFEMILGDEASIFIPWGNQQVFNSLSLLGIFSYLLAYSSVKLSMVFTPPYLKIRKALREKAP